MDETTQKVIKAQGEAVMRSQDNFLLRVHSIYDVAKVIPHPYNALAEMGNSLLHDYSNKAFEFKKYIEHVDQTLAENQQRIDGSSETIKRWQRKNSENEQKVQALEAERESWRELHHCDDTPSTYLGYKQPGAHPHHYGPDDVVVDGDWLTAELRDLARLRTKESQEGI